MPYCGMNFFLKYLKVSRLNIVFAVGGCISDEICVRLLPGIVLLLVTFRWWGGSRPSISSHCKWCFSTDCIVLAVLAMPHFCACVCLCVCIASVYSQQFSLSCVYRTSLPVMTLLWFRCCTGLCSSSATMVESCSKWRPALMWWGPVFRKLVSFPVPH